MTDEQLTENAMDHKWSFYERLFAKAYDFEITNTWDETKGETEAEGKVTTRRITKDPDIELAYNTLIEFRRAIVICVGEFKRLANEHRNAAEAMQTMVDRQKEQLLYERFHGIAQSLGYIIGPEPDLRSIWMEIATAPKDKTIRLLGKKLNGTTYLETGFWVVEEGRWSVEVDMTRGVPTHWTTLEERLPAGYR